ncbi:D-alanine--D-alanine ligase [Vibrio sp. SCSIO 43137]|uniref:D-alanine--D-alanine ligase n=1 Tax=Vibrio sp. SCSIO 43137 TaxID=3021011 RepID=UPI0023073FE6|nr:D-alanine--D-alanine ligase [Vibrio sp. SCSIO 43137]WCE32653.1 D-alanine--D-alanine ligase [Vibrio sp. SCSIO 43137]
MPEMDRTGPIVSRYEFWPTWFFYAPVVAQSLWHSLKYRSISLPLIANPSIWLSGMVGESKKDILNLAGKEAKKWILPFNTLRKNSSSTEVQLRDALEAMEQERLSFPVVAKPDKGCRGAGVRLVHNEAQLVDYIERFPQGADYLLQQKSDYDAEVGVFYMRYPGEKKGEVFSITLKYAPYVKGDGVKTLEQLIEDDPRAGQLAHIYKGRHSGSLDRVIPKDVDFRLAFAGSHSRGSIFKNGNQYITQALTEKLDEIFDDFDGFYYGRLDIKFKNIDSLMAGEDFQIIEINGASSEATHIWDSKTPLKEIFSTLLFQYRSLYKIGYLQKKAGHKPPSLRTLFKALAEEKALVKQYPSTD